MNKQVSVYVCQGPGSLATGGKEVLDRFINGLKDKGIPADVNGSSGVHKVGCKGLCARDVIVDVMIDGQSYTYESIKPNMADRIINEHIVEGAPVFEWLAKADFHQFYDKQVKVVLADCGEIDPESIDKYIERGGYEALRKVLTTMSPEEVVRIIKDSGLRGRGGGGFPTGIKWELCMKEVSDEKYIICNADEGDPGAFMDRAVIEGNPHSVIEGMIIGAYAIGSYKGYVYIRAEYPLAVERLRLALSVAKERGMLGNNIFDSEFSLDIKVKLGAGAFVCGEETALMASIEGHRGTPRTKPPFPVQKGLFAKPTIINNVETLANIPCIIRKGADWFASMGTATSKGTKVFSITGKVQNTGLIEVPMGITLKEIVYDIGGGMEDGKALKAVQTGGPSGGCIPASLMDIQVDYDSLTRAGSIMGSGGMIVLNEDDCMVNIAKFFLDFTQKESCGKCTPCRSGTRRLLEVLDRITEGEGKQSDIHLLEDLSSDIKIASLCGLGQTAPNPVLSTLKYFRDEYEAHIHEKRCPAGVCKALITFFIHADRCTGCTMCARVCPTGAAVGQKKEPHEIIQDRCVKCGACFEVCKFGAVLRK